MNRNLMSICSEEWDCVGGGHLQGAGFVWVRQALCVCVWYVPASGLGDRVCLGGWGCVVYSVCVLSFWGWSS